MFRLHFMPKMLYVETIDTELIIRAKSFPLWPSAYPQYIRYKQMDGWTRDRWQW